MTDLEEFLATARWFGGKGRSFRVVDVRHLSWLLKPPPVSEPEPKGPHPEHGGPLAVRIDLATVEYDDTTREVYQLPVAFYDTAQERLAHALIGHRQEDLLGEVFAYDAMHDRFATLLWLQGFVQRSAPDGMVFHRMPGHDLDETASSALLSGEQSNSSVAFGADSLMKVFRKVSSGRNPDIEICETLTRAGSSHVPALYGWLEMGADGQGEPLQLAMLQQFLRTASDGWELALASVRDLFAEGDLHADEVGGDFAGEAFRLGNATAEVHAALAEHFPTRRLTSEELAEVADHMRRRLDAAVISVPQLADHAAALRTTFDGVARITEPVSVQRVHGDFHLGQTLRTVKGWKLIDFEGEPAKPLAERVRPDSVWRDIAGMLRSFDYAAHAVAADIGDAGPQIAYRAQEWVSRNRAAFLDGYLQPPNVAGDASSDAGTHEAPARPGPSPDSQLLLDAYEADKAIYEAMYETRNRPSWIGIPLGAIVRLTSGGDNHP